jgi:hypothetical protein
MAATGAVLLGETLAGAGVMLGWTALVLTGSMALAFMPLCGTAADLEHARLGSTWIAAMFAGLRGNARVPR